MGRKNKICYLCGEPGADSKDHVPPRGLLPAGNYGNTQRITLPAHGACNRDSSSDEEYLRDLIVPEAVELNLPASDELYLKTRRSWERPEGQARYRRFIRTARPVYKVSPSGLYTGRAIGIKPELERVNAVGIKIARGIIYHDTGVRVYPESISIAPIKASEVPQEKFARRDEPYWIALSSDACLHDMFGEVVAIRRFYEGLPTQPEVQIACHMAIMLWNLFFVVMTVFPLSEIKNRDFKFGIDTSSGAWVKGDGAAS